MQKERKKHARDPIVPKKRRRDPIVSNIENAESVFSKTVSLC